MNQIRTIREEEIVLAKHLLTLAGKNPEEFIFPAKVDDYEGGVMGSINFTLGDSGDYAGDIIQVEYTDQDRIRVVITLTQNSKGELLDMDFWKENFTKLLQYPKPDQVSINTRGI
ncbi:hypothetical protein N7E81_12060 [Reichenbachiella carrageenanivorans]|uniref:DUF6984 domain-containing protein n=1 Tax=Reichenbachiella carrageenanivorans TaxID=2979869 RepID=A0ABY6CW06_9BACT|nr:hypothetical protein [Reichenbachiella carrageenanivorans]UXX78092.1 hypothetical protein N7E81_12060 [Reichenbachiella carrageenanivorans]